MIASAHRLPKWQFEHSVVAPACHLVIDAAAQRASLRWVMDDQRRRYPRLSVTTPAVVEIKTDARTAALFPATLFSLSCEGAGVTMAGVKPDVVQRGGNLRLRFPVAGQEVEIPARVMWHTRSGETLVGLELLLALAPAATRQTYAQWIVGVLRDRGLA